MGSVTVWPDRFEVEKLDGERLPLTARESVLRNLLRVVDMLLLVLRVLLVIILVLVAARPYRVVQSSVPAGARSVG